MESSSSSTMQVPSIQLANLSTRARVSLESSIRISTRASSKMISDSKSSVSSDTRYCLARARE